MKLKFRTIIIIVLLIAVSASAYADKKESPQRHRILISTDIGGTDPDDNQSMTHLLMYSNEFDIEGLVSSPSFGEGNKEEILRMIDMYEKDLRFVADSRPSRKSCVQAAMITAAPLLCQAVNTHRQTIFAVLRSKGVAGDARLKAGTALPKVPSGLFSVLAVPTAVRSGCLYGELLKMLLRLFMMHQILRRKYAYTG